MIMQSRLMHMNGLRSLKALLTCSASCCECVLVPRVWGMDRRMYGVVEARMTMSMTAKLYLPGVGLVSDWLPLGGE